MWNSRRASSFLFSPAFAEISRRLISFLEPSTIRPCRSHCPTPQTTSFPSLCLPQISLLGNTRSCDWQPWHWSWCLSSAYERESQFSAETWRVHVNGTEKVNVVGRLLIKELRPSHFDNEANPDSLAGNSDEATWVGLAMKMLPKTLRYFNFPFPEAIEGSLVYTLNVVWVRKKRPREGIASCDDRLDRTTCTAKKKIVLLVMVKGNNRLRFLYTRIWVIRLLA